MSRVCPDHERAIRAEAIEQSLLLFLTLSDFGAAAPGYRPRGRSQATQGQPVAAGRGNAPTASSPLSTGPPNSGNANPMNFAINIFWIALGLFSVTIPRSYWLDGARSLGAAAGLIGAGAVAAGVML